MCFRLVASFPQSKLFDHFINLLVMLRNLLLPHFRQGLAQVLVKRNVATTTKADGLPASQSVNESAADQNDAKIVHRSVKADSSGDNSSIAPPEARFIYPEFLPDPKFEWRNKLRERLEREDMLQRRSIIEIPEFYTGSIMAVSVTDVNAPTKLNRFLGICIQRGGCGLRAWFILRNVVDRQGIEIKYDMYCPLIQKIEVLRLEKRLDDSLLYLRDALPEYSTFPLDMEAEPRVDNSVVPINPLKVKLRPRPWLERWERQDLKGVQDLGLPQKFYDRAAELATPWVKYDLMLQYRKTIPAEEQERIYAEVYSQLQQQELKRRLKRRRGLPTD